MSDASVFYDSQVWHGIASCELMQLLCLSPILATTRTTNCQSDPAFCEVISRQIFGRKTEITLCCNNQLVASTYNLLCKMLQQDF